MQRQKTLAAVVALACAAALPASAQDTPAQADGTGEAVPQTVTVRGVRDPAMAPYADAYKMLSAVRTLGEGKVDLAIRLLSAKTLQPMPDLELTLRGETMSETLPLSADGFLDVPLHQRYLDDKAEFLTNKKKGSVRAEFYFVPKLPQDRLTYGDIAATVGAAKRAAAKVLPWYIRLLTTGIDEVRFCYPDQGQEIGLSNGARTARPAAGEQKNMLTKETVYCAAVSAREAEAAPQTVVTAPPGWVALFN